MPSISLEKLLRDKRVVAEIERHLWIESEKSGYDIGYEKAQEQWLKDFSKAWMQYHMPETFIESRKQAKRAAMAEAAASINANRASVAAERATVRRRRAKAYA